MKKYIFDLRKIDIDDFQLAKEYREYYEEIKDDAQYMALLRQQYNEEFERINKDIALNAQKHDFHIFCIHDGNRDQRLSVFRQNVSSIRKDCTNENIVLHFIGHGIVNAGRSIGVECLSWEELSNELQVIKQRENILQVNLMSVCCSCDFINFQQAYDKLWCINIETNDYFTPFEIYNNFDFKSFIGNENNVLKSNYIEHTNQID